MNNKITNTRQQAATLGHAYLEHKITWQNFMDETAAFLGDNLIDELIDMIEHEPKRGGFLGVNEKRWNEYQSALKNILEQLEK